MSYFHTPLFKHTEKVDQKQLTFFLFFTIIATSLKSSTSNILLNRPPTPLLPQGKEIILIMELTSNCIYISYGYVSIHI